MTTYSATDGIARIEQFRHQVGGAPAEWYVGVSSDAPASLDRHGLRDSSQSAIAFPCADEQTARAIEAHFLQAGFQPDRNGGGPTPPATQVYVFHAPKLTGLRQWLREQELKTGGEGARRRKRQEWVATVSRLLERLESWLTDADPEGLLGLRRSTAARDEIDLGRYEVSELAVEYGDTVVHIIPMARVAPRTIALAPGVEVKAQGRIDVTNGITKYHLYRTLESGKERWHILGPDTRAVELNQETFAGLMEDLLS